MRNALCVVPAGDEYRTGGVEWGVKRKVWREGRDGLGWVVNERRSYGAVIVDIVFGKLFLVRCPFSHANGFSWFW